MPVPVDIEQRLLQEDFIGEVTIKTWHGTYLHPNFASKTIEYKAEPYQWTLAKSPITEVKAYCISASNGGSKLYWKSDLTQSNKNVILTENSSHWEAFTLAKHQKYSDKFAIVSHGSKQLVCAESPERKLGVVANRDGHGEWEAFEFTTSGAATSGAASSSATYTPGSLQDKIDLVTKATKGWGYDGDKLIQAIISIEPSELPKLDAHYKASYGKSIMEVIRSETGGNFGIALAMAVCLETYTAAEIIRDAIRGIGKDEKRILEVLVGRTNGELNEIKSSYQTLYGRNLESDLAAECGAEAKQFFVSQLQALRDEHDQNRPNVDADVETLYKASEARWGKDAGEFVRLFNTRSEQHLLKVFQAYGQKHGKTMEKLVKDEFKGFMEDVLVENVRCIFNKPLYFADLMESAMSGLGCDAHKLARVINRLRGRKIMEQAKEAYLNKHGKSLEKKIKSETTGDFERLLVAMINQPTRFNY